MAKLIKSVAVLFSKEVKFSFSGSDYSNCFFANEVFGQKSKKVLSWQYDHTGKGPFINDVIIARPKCVA